MVHFLIFSLLAQVLSCTFFEAYILLLSGLSSNYLFYSMSMPESDRVGPTCERLLSLVNFGQGLHAILDVLHVQT